MTTDELIKRISEAARAGDWTLVQPLFVELKRLMVEQGRPLSSSGAAQIVEALAEGRGLSASLLGGAGVSPLIMQVRALATKTPLNRKALQTAWDSLYQLLANPTAQVEQQDMRDLLLGLRAGRVFDLLAKTADRAVTRFPTDAMARRLYGQALIDEGQINAGIEMLRSGLRITPLEEKEHDELWGLLGRAHKQIYVDHVKAGAPAATRLSFRSDLEQAIASYAEVYDPARPERNYWHGVNLVDLLQLARADGHGDIKNPTGIAPEEIAKRIIDKLEPNAANTTDPWVLGTLGNCYLARHDMDKAIQYFSAYVRDPKTTPFHLHGTVRQLEEVFRLQPGNGDGGRILAILKEGQVASAESSFHFDGDSLRSLGKFAGLEENRRHSETMVPGGGFVKLGLLQLVVRRAAGIAALCDETGATKGTGFLLRGSDINPKWGNDVVLLTNAHVVSDPARPGYESEAPLRPSTTRIVLEGAGRQRIECEPTALWQSPIAQHDATIVRLSRGLPEGVLPLDLCPPGTALKPVDPDAQDKGGAGSRISVIGYPLGGPLSLSVVGSISGANGLLIDVGCRRKGEADPTYLHYRAPTEPGNSGSPVFETENWTVVGLHHEGFDQFDGRAKLDGKPGKSYANEGISIHSIIRAVGKTA
jgi:tetratricopeptide (TPR) repeat protein